MSERLPWRSGNRRCEVGTCVCTFLRWAGTYANGMVYYSKRIIVVGEADFCKTNRCFVTFHRYIACIVDTSKKNIIFIEER